MKTSKICKYKKTSKLLRGDKHDEIIMINEYNIKMSDGLIINTACIETLEKIYIKTSYRDRRFVYPLKHLHFLVCLKNNSQVS
uniref:Uncharacterized protein n=1 Tax=Rhizophora mucronata TaxID=61149 RepID=A0A2P2LMD7_RHIMU